MAKAKKKTKSLSQLARDYRPGPRSANFMSRLKAHHPDLHDEIMQVIEDFLDMKLEAITSIAALYRWLVVQIDPVELCSDRHFYSFVKKMEVERGKANKAKQA